MTSLLTNVAARTALATLTMTNKQLDMTQSRISTGFRVGTAQDNAAYWSIATTMRSDNAALSTVQDALGLGSATVDVAYNAIQSSIDVVKEIKSKLVAAREPGVDKSKVQSEITELQNQLKSVADASVFSGRELARRQFRYDGLQRDQADRGIVLADQWGRLDRHDQHQHRPISSCTTPTLRRSAFSTAPAARRVH